MYVHAPRRTDLGYASLLNSSSFCRALSYRASLSLAIPWTFFRQADSRVCSFTSEHILNGVTVVSGGGLYAAEDDVEPCYCTQIR